MESDQQIGSKTNSAGNELSDLALINAYKESRNDQYFSLLYRRYKQKVFAKCISMLKSESQARDAVQEIFIKIFLNLSRFREDARFSTWLYSITYNYCIDRIRRKKRTIEIYTEDLPQLSNENDHGVNEKILLEMEVERLEKVLDNIPPGDKAILLMKYQDGMKIREIGAALDKTDSSIKMKILRAKQKAVLVYHSFYGEKKTL